MTAASIPARPRWGATRRAPICRRPSWPATPTSSRSGRAQTAIYTGSSVDGLTQLTCAPGYAGSGATFLAHAGTTYRIQIGRPYGAPLNVSMAVTPPPNAQFYFQPGDPSVFDSIGFSDISNDP